MHHQTTSISRSYASSFTRRTSVPTVAAVYSFTRCVPSKKCTTISTAQCYFIWKLPPASIPKICLKKPSKLWEKQLARQIPAKMKAKVMLRKLWLTYWKDITRGKPWVGPLEGGCRFSKRCATLILKKCKHPLR